MIGAMAGCGKPSTTFLTSVGMVLVGLVVKCVREATGGV
jgi:hypothetical protein